MKRRLGAGLQAIDQWLAPAYLRAVPERPALLTFLFHGISESDASPHSPVMDPAPQQGMTAAHFHRFINYFLEHRYQFVSTAQVQAGLAPGQHVLITFDDGYANNLNVLPVLREYGVPATFFISAGHVQNGRSFWWDVLYRERHRRGASVARITVEKERLKTLSHDQVERLLVAEFGATAFRPVGDADRPLTPAELRAFAREPLVTLGNHTFDHAILTNCPPEVARTQIALCQSVIRDLTGVTPDTISYPNGNFSEKIAAIALQEGLRMGIGLEFRKNYLPLDPTGPGVMSLGRFLVRGGPRLAASCAAIRSEVSLYLGLRRFVRGRS